MYIKCVRPNGRCKVEPRLFSSVSPVLPMCDKSTRELIYVKSWHRRDDFGSIHNSSIGIDLLLEGLTFNRRFAPGVYLGVAYLEKNVRNGRKFLRGRLIKHPRKDNLKTNVPYTLVMRRLNEEWRLDYQLHPSRLGTKMGMEFLAEEVAHMHENLYPAPISAGKAECISSKLGLNVDLFNQALDFLSVNYKDVEKYKSITDIMYEACETYSESFEQRSREGHIKRCHGDLKTSNLWVRPAWCQRIGIQRFRKEVLVLDCIDFNPEFYNIDTLSDIAMLGVDIEMHTMVDQSIQQQENLSEYFLYSYLKEAGEDRQSVRPLLEYYLAEKAMVRAFMCVLYDSQLLLGEKYLEIALRHVRRLEQLILDKTLSLFLDKMSSVAVGSK